MDDNGQLQIAKQEFLNFYITASLEGWCNPNRQRGIKVTLPNGNKQITFEDPDRFPHLKYVDEWWVNPRGGSGGLTLALYDEVPFFQMSYGGWYPEDLADDVKRILRATYEDGEFIGGRGPARLEWESEVYGAVIYHHNRHGPIGRSAPDCDPSEFFGYETVTLNNPGELKRQLGQHHIFGLTLGMFADEVPYYRSSDDPLGLE